MQGKRVKLQGDHDREIENENLVTKQAYLQSAELSQRREMKE